MSGQANEASGGETPTATTEDGGATPTATTDAASSSDAADPQAELAALRKQNAELLSKKSKLEEDLGKHRKKKNEAEALKEKALLEAGDLKPLLEKREAQVSSLEAKVAELEPLAQARRDWESAERDRINEAANGLDDEAKQLLANQPLEQQAVLLERLRGKPKERPPEHPAGDPSSHAPESFAALRGDQLTEAIERDPKGWADHVRSAVRKPLTSWERRRQAGARAE